MGDDVVANVLLLMHRDLLLELKHLFTGLRFERRYTTQLRLVGLEVLARLGDAILNPGKAFQQLNLCSHVVRMGGSTLDAAQQRQEFPPALNKELVLGGLDLGTCTLVIQLRSHGSTVRHVHGCKPQTPGRPGAPYACVMRSHDVMYVQQAELPDWLFVLQHELGSKVFDGRDDLLMLSAVLDELDTVVAGVQRGHGTLVRPHWQSLVAEMDHTTAAIGPDVTELVAIALTPLNGAIDRGSPPTEANAPAIGRAIEQTRETLCDPGARRAAWDDALAGFREDIAPEQAAARLRILRDMVELAQGDWGGISSTLAGALNDDTTALATMGHDVQVIRRAAPGRCRLECAAQARCLPSVRGQAATDRSPHRLARVRSRLATSVLSVTWPGRVLDGPGLPAMAAGGAWTRRWPSP